MRSRMESEKEEEEEGEQKKLGNWNNLRKKQRRPCSLLTKMQKRFRDVNARERQNEREEEEDRGTCIIFYNDR
jgi:hypothetical protein